MEELMDALSEDAQTLKDTIVVQKASDKTSIKTSNKSMQCSGVNITIPKDAMNVFLNSFQEKFMASSMYQQGITKLIEQSSIAYQPLHIQRTCGRPEHSRKSQHRYPHQEE